MNCKLKNIVLICILCIALPLIFVSCEDEKNNMVIFDLKKHDFNKWSELVKVESVASLEQNDSCCVSIADRCVVSKDCFFIYDKNIKAIYKFNLDGKIIRKIGERGRGKSEYLNIRDLCIGQKNNAIVAMDERGLISFDCIDGCFNSRLKFNSSVSALHERFGIIGNDSYICYDIDNNSITLDAPDGLRVLRKLECYPFVIDFFYQYESNHYVLSGFGDFYIDKYENGKLKKVYEFDLGKEKLPEKLIPKTLDEIDVVYNKPEYFKSIVQARESSKWLYVKFLGPQVQYYTAIINKNNGKVAFGANFALDVVGVDGDSFYAMVYPAYLSHADSLYEILSANGIVCNEESAPVLLKFSINEKMLQ